MFRSYWINCTVRVIYENIHNTRKYVDVPRKCIRVDENSLYTTFYGRSADVHNERASEGSGDLYNVFERRCLFQLLTTDYITDGGLKAYWVKFKIQFHSGGENERPCLLLSNILAGLLAAKCFRAKKKIIITKYFSAIVVDSDLKRKKNIKKNKQKISVLWARKKTKKNLSRWWVIRWLAWFRTMRLDYTSSRSQYFVLKCRAWCQNKRPNSKATSYSVDWAEKVR